MCAHQKNCLNLTERLLTLVDELRRLKWRTRLPLRRLQLGSPEPVAGESLAISENQRVEFKGSAIIWPFLDLISGRRSASHLMAANFEKREKSGFVV